MKGRLLASAGGGRGRRDDDGAIPRESARNEEFVPDFDI